MPCYGSLAYLEVLAVQRCVGWRERRNAQYAIGYRRDAYVVVRGNVPRVASVQVVVEVFTRVHGEAAAVARDGAVHASYYACTADALRTVRVVGIYWSERIVWIVRITTDARRLVVYYGDNQWTRGLYAAYVHYVPCYGSLAYLEVLAVQRSVGWCERGYA